MICNEFTGHGVGKHFHEPPLVFSGKNDSTVIMKPGMVFTIEPILNQFNSKYSILQNNWNAITEKGNSAQFEHTILITENGCDVLT